MKPLLERLRRVDKSLSRRNTRSQKRSTRGLSLSHALPVGYLGFCARIGHSACTFSKGKERQCPAFLSLRTTTRGGGSHC